VRDGPSLPRPFSLPWGAGKIVEEASFVGQHHRPALQLLEFDDGTVRVRFCYYDLAGRFQRNPLIIGPDTIAGLAVALSDAPQLRAVLGRLLGNGPQAEIDGSRTKFGGSTAEPPAVAEQ
jgi:hypothetical protein